ncbi:uncharacterized protein LOC127789662 [Diospyros lotus]|uniref:uncharacterized protein LOC127789662 n=1 Tax=Diospyros lotus TaxID=55363 RepID=UPI0022559B95|nr:uncharacterized protein LOC127789662 [Diospyros lotus]
MEVESQASSKDQKPIGGRPAAAAARKKRARNICLVAIAVILGLLLILLILGFTVFKAKHPVTTVDSVALKDFKLSLDIARLRVLLNVSLDVDLSVKNPNKVGFKYTNSSALLKYRNQVVGEAPLPAAKIPADRTVPMNLTLTLMADRLLTNSKLYSDVLSGTLPLSTFTRISGKVQIFNIFKIHVVSYTSCDLNLDVMSRTVANQTCHYKTKL